MKYIVLVPDGAADEPLDKLNGKTPLEAAVTNNMDFLAKNGLCAEVQTIPEGMAPGSDVGNLALMGYDPRRVLTGRSPLEAANLGIMLADDEIAFRCNLVTVHDGVMDDYSAGHISTEQGSLLIKALTEQLDVDGVRFYPGKSYRHIMVIKAPDVAKYIKIPTVAPHDIPGERVDAYLPKGHGAKLLLDIMNKAQAIFTGHEVNQVRLDLKENPATGIWLWGQGTRPQLQRFADKFDLPTSGAMISAVDLVNGIGRLAGLEIIDVPGATGYFDTDYAAKARYALAALKTHDFLYVHVEAPDEAGHLGSVREKVTAIERFDADVVGPIVNYADGRDDVRILIAPDHPTPIAKRVHTDDPVPFVMFGAGVVPNDVEVYGETAAADKGVMFESGAAMMARFINNS